MGNQQATLIFKDYLDIKKALRGHTQDVLTDNAEDDEMVQTTTTK